MNSCDLSHKACPVQSYYIRSGFHCVGQCWSRHCALLITHQVSVVCSWDSSIHDSVHLNRITSPNERIYLIAKVTLQLSHPASMELVVRKRIAVNVYNKQVSARHGPVKTTQTIFTWILFESSLWSYMHVSSTELHPESEEEDVLEEHILLLWTYLWDCFQHTKGATVIKKWMTSVPVLWFILRLPVCFPHRPRRSMRSGKHWPSWRPVARRRRCMAESRTWRNTHGGC